MPKKADPTDTVDPVRAQLARAAAASVAPVATVVQSPVIPAPVNPAVVRAVGEGGPVLAPALKLPDKPSSGSSPTVNRKIIVTAEEAERMEQSANVISAAFGGRVNYSQISRAMWSVLAGAEEVMQANARRATKRLVPSKGNPTGLAEYEHDLAQFLATILKR